MNKVLKKALLGSIVTAMLTSNAYAANSYSIPDHLTPVSEWTDGFTNTQAEHFRTTYAVPSFFMGDDSSAFTFLNLSEVLPTATINRGGPVTELAFAPMPQIGDVIATTDLGTMSLSDAIADPRSRLQAIAVVHKGKVVYEQYPGMPQDSVHMWSSTAKTISGVLMHQLVAEGLIDLDAPVSKYLDFTKGSPIGAIKVNDVLNMRAGIDFEENQANRMNPEHPISWAFGAGLTGRGVPSDGPSLKEIVVKIPALTEPNTAYGYSTFNTAIMGWIMEEVTGKPWNELVSDRIWKKAGMGNDALVGLSPDGDVLGGGIFAGTMRDFIRYSLLFTPSSGVISSEAIVPEDYLKAVYAETKPEIYLKGEQGPGMVKRFEATGSPIGNSYQWDAVFADGDLYKSGLLGQALYVSPETDTAVLYFSTTWQSSQAMVPYTREIVQQLFRDKK